MHCRVLVTNQYGSTFVCKQHNAKCPNTKQVTLKTCHFKNFLLYTYPLLKMALVYNTSHEFTYIKLPRQFEVHT